MSEIAIERVKSAVGLVGVGVGGLCEVDAGFLLLLDFFDWLPQEGVWDAARRQRQTCGTDRIGDNPSNKPLTLRSLAEFVAVEGLSEV